MGILKSKNMKLKVFSVQSCSQQCWSVKHFFIRFLYMQDRFFTQNCSYSACVIVIGLF